MIENIIKLRKIFYLHRLRKFWSSVFEALWNWYLLFPLNHKIKYTLNGTEDFLNFEIPCTWMLLKNNGKIWHFLHQKRDIRHHLDIKMWHFHEDVCNSRHIWGYLDSIFCVSYLCNLVLKGSQRPK